MRGGLQLLPWTAFLVLLVARQCSSRSAYSSSRSKPSPRRLTPDPEELPVKGSKHLSDPPSDLEDEGNCDALTEEESSDEEEEESSDDSDDDDEDAAEQDDLVQEEATDVTVMADDSVSDVESKESDGDDDEEDVVESSILPSSDNESDELSPKRSRNTDTEGAATMSSSTAPDAQPTAADSLRAKSRRNPPNASMRWMLQQGRIGRTVALLFVLLWELLSTYLPHAVSSAVAALVPAGAPQRRSQQQSKNRRSSQKDATQSADRAALEQLQRMGKDVRYSHVSVSFLQRHGLGPYRDEDGLVSEDADVPVDDVADFDGPTTTENDDQESEHEMDDDLDWVVQALQTKRTDPSTSADDDDDERTSQERIARAAVATERPKMPRRTNSGSSSSSLLLGGLDKNRFSRNLFGAYPGDAVSVDEAASPKGVTELARRYGWGDWEDTDDEEGYVRPKGRRKRRRRRRRSSLRVESNRGSIDDVFDIPEWDRDPFEL